MAEDSQRQGTRQGMGNAFEFVAVAGQRAKQLMNGCVPRVEGAGKPARTAEREVASGKVRKLE